VVRLVDRESHRVDIRYHLDEHIDSAVAAGLRLRGVGGITGAPSTSSAIVPAPPSPSTGSPRFWPATTPPERIRSALPRHKKRGTSIGPGRSRESSAADAQGVIHSL